MKRSESITALAKALVAFNSEVSKISKDADNPFFKNKYSTLDTIIEEVRPILQKNGLSIMQFPEGDGQNITVTTYLLHESGEWIQSPALTLKPVKNDPQAAGSAITYARRYSIQAFLSLNTGEDDDGNAATHKEKPQQQQQQRQQQSQGQQSNNSNNYNTNLASEKQQKLVHSLISQIAKKNGLEKDFVIETLKTRVGTFDSVESMTSKLASAAIKDLQDSLG